MFESQGFPRETRALAIAGAIGLCALIVEAGPAAAITFTNIAAPLPDVYDGSLSWGDYDNDGDLDLLVAGWNHTGTEFERVYRNDGGGTFTDILAGLPGVAKSSVSWGDYDNDGDVDILVTGMSGASIIARVYRNNGNNTFTLISAGLTGVQNGSVAWGDYDNDGDLDILLTGKDASSTPIARVYRNDGGNTFTNITAGLPGVYASSVAWGDYDNDGDLDILLAGFQSGTLPSIARVYRNDGGGTFTNVNAALDGVGTASVAWGDYDNDGDLDILLAGFPNGGALGLAQVYRNDGGGTFTNINAALLSVQSSSVAWGDYDNDGDLDIALTGLWVPAPVSRIYRNDGGGTFTDIFAPLTDVQSGSVAWGDYDNDGDLDIALLGYAGTDGLARIYRSDGVATPNTAPAAPTNLAAMRNGSNVTFAWTGASDAQTPTAGLSYNLRIGTTPGGNQINAAMANSANGYRRVARLGNAQQRTAWTVALPAGLYYWSVQAVDGAFAGSPFAAEKTFGPFNEIAAPLPAVYQGSLSWGDYDNDGDLDLLVTGRDFALNDYASVYRNDGGGTFTDIFAALPGVVAGSVAWGDYDNDGDLDILLTGVDPSFTRIARVYRNDGGGTFTDIVAGLPGVLESSVAWGDYDNDGDLDILLTGEDPSATPIARVYRNDGGGAFADINAGLPGVHLGAVAWGDCDNDGDLDILLTGLDASFALIARVYRNDRGGIFTDVNAGLPGVLRSSVSWGDYDHDGDLDILLTGEDSSSIPIARVCRNDGGNTFTILNVGLPGVGNGSVAWGDYDNDGDLDILLTGFGGAYIARVYRYDGGNAFTNINAGLPGVQNSSVAWGDYDNDGDLDIALLGYTGTVGLARIYRSEGIAPPNTAPAAPTNLSALRSGGNVTFAWTGASDAQTPSTGLSYNLRIGTTPGGNQISAAMANNVNGYRRVARLGNAQQRTSWALTLPAGVYYWSVQAVDGAFAGSPFASEKTFAPFNDLAAPLPAVFRGGLSWGDYDNDGDLDLLVTGEDNSENPYASVFRNDGGGTFTDINAGLAGVSFSAVAWGDYDNDGDLDILLTGLDASFALITRVYRNDGGNTFTDINAVLPGAYQSSVAWGDYDNDGDLDILLSGSTGASRITRVYTNYGAGSFTDLVAGLPGVNLGSVGWGDYDNDGDLDILLSGSTGASRIARVYTNSGAGSFTDLVAGLPGVMFSSVGWGDYDDDGDLDILLTGQDASPTPITRVYRNDGGGGFADINAGLPGVDLSAVAWGDYDNDGDLDILLTGYGGVLIARVYRNDGGGTFADANAGLPGVQESAVAWGDYDSDGDLDIALLGSAPSGLARIYRSDGVVTPNTVPAAPTNLNAVRNGNNVTFSWNAATDTQTPQPGLSYNLRVGTTPGGSQISAAMANDANGYRRVARLGNAQQRTSWTLALPADPYYWSVQAVDGAFAGSPFATWTTGVEDPGPEKPAMLELAGAAPNPIPGAGVIRYALPQASRVRLEAYDVAGRRVATLVDGVREAGRHVVRWDGRGETGALRAGVYLLRLEAAGAVRQRKVVVTQ